MFLISNESDEYNIEKILIPYKINHLIGANSKVCAIEIINNIEKLVTHSYFGPEKYLSKDTDISNEKIKKSDQRDQALEKIIGKVDRVSVLESPFKYLKSIGNELITNAVYEAARREEGKSNFIEFDGRQSIELAEGEEVNISIGLDERQLVLSVEDCFGTFTRKEFLQNILRSFKEKAPSDKKSGAGLGLYLVASYSNQVVVNILPEVNTEVIAIIDNNKRFKNFKKRITSFHFFVEEKG